MAEQPAGSEYLFSYGTLQPTLAPASLAPLVSRFEHVGEGFVHGRLYDLGDYPGAVPDASCESRIEGTVFRLPVDPQVLSRLDAYEEFNPQSWETSLFVRVVEPVRMMSGSELNCWMYVYRGPLEDAAVLAAGRFPGRRTLF